MKKTATVICLLAVMVMLSGCEGQSDKKVHPDDNQETQLTTKEVGDMVAETVSPKPTVAPDIKETGEDSSEVAETTVRPTATPEATPTPELSKDPIEYGDLTEYFWKPASEVIKAFDRPYRYDYWGSGHETEAEGGFTFDDKVYFGFNHSGEYLEPSREVRSLIIYNDEAKEISAGIGRGLNVKMKYSEIKNVIGESLHGPVANEDGTQYCAYGEYYYVGYYFAWKQSPIQNDVPADTVMVYDYWTENHTNPSAYVLRKPVQEYLEENQKLLFTEHKEQLRKELQAVYQYEPVCKYNLLETIKVDARNVVEVYEMACYGCPPNYVTNTTDYGGKEFSFDGIDKTKNLSGYYVKLRLVSDGQIIDTYYIEDEADQESDYKADAIYGGFWWTGSDDLEVNAIRKMIGMSGKQKECEVSSATTRRPVTEEGYDFAELFTAYYLNGNPMPSLIKVVEAYESQDGGMTVKILKTSDGNDLLNGRKLAKEGTGTICGHEVTWKLYDTPCGIQIVTTYTSEGEEWGGTWREYVILDDCLINYYSFYSL